MDLNSIKTFQTWTQMGTEIGTKIRTKMGTKMIASVLTWQFFNPIVICQVGFSNPQIAD